MPEFLIRSLSVEGMGVRPGRLDFDRGVNLICGDSDVGKSYVFDCINFMFGAKKMRLQSSSGYNTVIMEIETPGGLVRLERRFDVRKAAVSIFTKVPGLARFNCTGADADMLDRFWLALLGVDENQTVVSQSCYKHELLHFENIVSFLMLRETGVSADRSIIQSAVKPLSVLLFLLTGEDFANHPEMESLADLRKKASGERKQIKSQMREKLDREKAVLEELSHGPLKDMPGSWLDLLNRFSLRQDELKNATKESQSLHEAYAQAKKELQASLLQRENHELLQNLYDARMKRMDFSLEGSLIASGEETEGVCPFCHGKINMETVPASFLQAADAEIRQTGDMIRQLESVVSEVDQKIAREQACVDDLEQKITVLDRQISESMMPAVEELKSEMDRYLDYVRLDHEKDLLGADLMTLQTRLDTLSEVGVDQKLLFRPKEELPDDFRNEMGVRVREMLSACGMPFDRAEFELNTMDLSVESQDKRSFGEGYRAFLNTVLGFCLFRHFCEAGTYKPGLLFVDSPTQALKEGENDACAGKMYAYMIQNSSCGQVFIIENRLPEGLDTRNAKVHYLKDGFLPDFHHPVRKKP